MTKFFTVIFLSLTLISYGQNTNKIDKDKESFVKRALKVTELAHAVILQAGIVQKVI